MSCLISRIHSDRFVNIKTMCFRAVFRRHINYSRTFTAHFVRRMTSCGISVIRSERQQTCCCTSAMKEIRQLCSVYSALWSNLCIQCCVSIKGRPHKIYCGNQHAHDMLGFVGRRYDSRTRDLNAMNNTNKKLHSAIRPPCWSELSPFRDLFQASVFARYNLKSLHPGAGNTQCSRACLLFLRCASGKQLSAKHVESRHSKLFVQKCAEYRDVFLQRTY